MQGLIRSFAAFWAMAVLIACTSAPGSPETPKRSETVEPTQVAGVQPTGPVHAPTPTWPQPATIDAGHLSPALRMNAGRAAHTATLLPDGKVLIAGGFRQEGTSEIAIASAEIYDPEANDFTPTADMNEARSGHTATLLPTGQVLIVGGWGVSGRNSTAELYDPQTGEFRYAASMAAPRASMTATLLKNGQVLIAGGDSARDTPQLIAEIYDPATNTFTQGSSLNRGRSAHTATLLNDGNVLFVGGHSGRNTVSASAEIYEPATGKFTPTGSLNMVRHKHAAVLLQDGNVLVIGGSDQNDWRGKYTSAEIYDISTGTFTPIAGLNRERFKLADAAVLLNDGNVLVGGGNRQVEIYDARDRRFILGENLDSDYFYSVLTRLIDGRVLITGGYDSSIRPSDQAWIYSYGSIEPNAVDTSHPGAPTAEGTPAMVCPDTEPLRAKPPDDPAVQGSSGYGYYFVNQDRSIWASAWWAEDKEYHWRAGQDGIKVGWFRPAGAVLEITGQRLDAQAPPLEAHVPCCYPTRFQATGLIFPTEGCWQVTAEAAGSKLEFVVRVEP